jgi:hypothetical protein
VGLTRQIGQHGLRSDERTLCVDDPLGVAGQMDIVAEDAFRTAHARAGDNTPLYLGHLRFEGFETIQTVGGSKAAVA